MRSSFLSVLIAVTLVAVGIPAAYAADTPPATAPQSMELKFAKSLWESSGADKMKAGDWAEYEMPAIPGSKSRQEVVEVGDHYTVVLTKGSMMGQKQEMKTKTVYSEPDPDKAAVEKQQKELKMEYKEADDKIKVGDKELAVKRHEVYQDGKLASKSWISKELCLNGGVVRAEGPDGSVYTLLVGFGHGK